MIRATLIAAMLAALGACGVDGNPTPPEPRPATGISVSGTAEFGIAGGS